MSASLTSQIQSYFKKNGKGELLNAIKGKVNHPPSEVAEKYIDILKNSIHSNLKYSNVAEAIDGFGYSYTENDDGSYIVEINFAKDLTRDSLYPEKYPEGVYNLAGLYDKGFNAKGKVYGYWGGVWVTSRDHAAPSNFMNDARATFMSNYASKYNVESVEIRGDFYG